MIRQAHTYLVGAMSGATLIAIAIAVFVLLVSAQVFRDWPVAGLGEGGNEAAAISDAKPTAAGGSSGATAGSRAASAPAGGAKKAGGASQPGSVATNGGAAGQGQDAGLPGPTAAGGAGGGSDNPSSTQVQRPSSPSGGSASSGGGGAGTAAGSSPSGQVTGAVNNTVTEVDETALGGTLGKTGVTGVTEGVGNSVAGPESAVGKVVDEAVGAAGGLLPGNR